MSEKKIYFVTDAHLGSTAGIPVRDNERRLVRWMDSIRPDCEALYLMGDMIDFWYEYRRVVPKGYARFFGKLAEFTDAGIPVRWFAGNHDIWLYSYVQDELGVEVIRQPMETLIKGHRFFLDHGDGLGDPHLGTRFLAWFFNNRFNQWLFSNLMPANLGMKLGNAWSRHSFEKRKCDGSAGYLGEDKEYLVAFAKQHSAQAAAGGRPVPEYYVFGHRHIVLDLQLASGSRVLIVGDWIKEFTYGVFDGDSFEIRSWE